MHRVMMRALRDGFRGVPGHVPVSNASWAATGSLANSGGNSGADTNGNTRSRLEMNRKTISHCGEQISVLEQQVIMYQHQRRMAEEDNARIATDKAGRSQERSPRVLPPLLPPALPLGEGRTS